MKNSVFIFLLVVCSLFTLFLTGCSTSYVVTKNGDNDDKMSYKEFNWEIKGENVTLKLTKGPESEGLNIRVDTNYAKWQDFKLQETRSIPTGLLKTVTRQNRFLGSLEGLGFGILSGAALGILAGLKYGGDEVYSGETGGTAAFVMSVIGGLVGGLVGAIFGSINGHKYEYKFIRK
jgi:hypothetical protein